MTVFKIGQLVAVNNSCPMSFIHGKRGAVERLPNNPDNPMFGIRIGVEMWWLLSDEIQLVTDADASLTKDFGYETQSDRD